MRGARTFCIVQRLTGPSLCESRAGADDVDIPELRRAARLSGAPTGRENAQPPRGRPIFFRDMPAHPVPALEEDNKTAILRAASREGLTPSPTCRPGQGGSREGMRPIGNDTGRAAVSPPRQCDGGSFMPDVLIGYPDEHHGAFVDPWSHQPQHRGDIPDHALFVGAWHLARRRSRYSSRGPFSCT